MAQFKKTSFQLFVAGRKGQGKTTLTDAVARGFNRIFVFDTLGEYQAKGFVRVHSIAELKAEVKKRWKKGWRVAYLPAAANRQQQLHEMCEAICAIQLPYFNHPDLSNRAPPIPKVLFIIEEMRWSYPQSCTLEGMPTLTTLGRHYGVNLIGTTQRCAEVSTNFRGTSDARYFFAQDEDADIKMVGRMIGGQHIGTLKALAPHHYLCLSNGRVFEGQNKLRK